MSQIVLDEVKRSKIVRKKTKMQNIVKDSDVTVKKALGSGAKLFSKPSEEAAVKELMLSRQVGDHYNILRK